MYEYKFVTADSNGFFRVETYKGNILKYAKDGWRFITAIPLDQTMEGHVRSFTLVFEKEIEEDLFT